MNTKKHKIIIDNVPGQDFEANSGETLKDALTAQGFSIPSACGGRGICGLCRIRVMEGGSEVQPTETKKITSEELNKGMRLSCQVKVEQDIRVQISPNMLDAKEYECEVVSNRNVASFIKELVLQLPPDKTIDFKAGAFVQLEAPPYQLDYTDIDVEEEYRELWTKFNVWKYKAGSTEYVQRTYSMANYPGENDNQIKMNVRIATPAPNVLHGKPGIVSSYIFGLKPGDKVKISGPYGSFFAKDTAAEMCFVGGGAGMAPLRSHILDQLKRLKSNRKMTFWYGARNPKEMFYGCEFDKLEKEHPNFSWNLAYSDKDVDDDKNPLRGFIHNVMYEQYLKDHPAPESIEYYLCGPPIMIKVTEEMLLGMGVPAENILFDDFGS